MVVTRRKSTLPFLALALAGLGAACDTATTQSYPGPPLSTLHGTMTARDGLALTHPVRLAIAWFSYFSPQTGQPTSAPQGVVTDEVQYTGSFPQTFSFALTSLPPAEAVTTDATGTRGAVGIVVAYEDLNGDGRLTVSTGDAAVVDRVIGASSDAFVHLLDPRPGVQAYVVYAESVPSGSAPGLQPGYLLVSARPLDGGFATDTQPLADASLDLELVDDPALNLLACSDFYGRLGAGNLFQGSSCGISLQPDADMILASTDYLGASGSARVSIGRLGADGGWAASPLAQDAGVTINAHPIPWSGTGFTLYEATRSVLLDGTNVVRVVRPGQPVWEASGSPPPPFTVSAPAHVQVNAPFTVSWVPGAGDHSTFTVFAGTQHPTATGNTAPLVAPSTPGDLTISIFAMQPFTSGPSVLSTRSESVTVVVDP